MDAYVYNAALWCGDCIKAIKERLEAAGKKPENSSDERSYDSDQWPKGPFPDGGGESDSPSHCDGCHCHLENTLTSDGVDYVIEAIKDHVLDPHPNPGECLDEWASSLNAYALDADQKFIMDAYERVRNLERQIEANKPVIDAAGELHQKHLAGKGDGSYSYDITRTKLFEAVAAAKEQQKGTHATC